MKPPPGVPPWLHYALLACAAVALGVFLVVAIWWGSWFQVCTMSHGRVECYKGAPWAPLVSPD